jgi:tetratricopeptide (TPR) repeat protein
MGKRLAAVLLLVGMAGATPVGSPRRKHKPHRAAAAEPVKQSSAAPVPEIFTTTSSSPEARALYDSAIEFWETLHTEQALAKWRRALELDPHFAAAHALLSYASPEPTEQARERAAAKALAGSVSPSEALLIRWFVGVREDNYVEAIAAMNDLLERYPRDKHLQLWSGAWLFRMNEYGAAQQRLEKAVALDAGYSAALNELGYAYASLKDYPRAVETMQRCVALLPGEPNPEDSLAEILRMSAHYDEALEHYRKALSIDPRFHSSQLGIADTYSLMGQQRKAREAYFEARVLAPGRAIQLSDELQSAFTYVRDHDTGGADQAFLAVAQHAHKAGLAQFEAEALRMRALVQLVQSPADLVSVEQQHARRRLFGMRSQPAVPELAYLEEAERVLKQAGAISESDRQDEYALLLRVRVEAAARRGRFSEAAEELKKLQAMSSGSKSSAIAHAFEGAQGALLTYQSRWADAVPSLERDQENVFSLFRLALAYQSVGDLQSSQQTQATLTSFNVPTAEQSFVVPAIRDRILSGKMLAEKQKN